MTPSQKIMYEYFVAKYLLLKLGLVRNRTGCLLLRKDKYIIAKSRMCIGKLLDEEGIEDFVLSSSVLQNNTSVFNFVTSEDENEPMTPRQLAIYNDFLVKHEEHEHGNNDEGLLFKVYCDKTGEFNYEVVPYYDDKQKYDDDYTYKLATDEEIEEFVRDWYY